MDTRDLSAHSPYVPGRGVEEVARELGVEPDALVKLSSNENPHGPSPAAMDAAREAVSHAHVYPKAAHTDLTAALADRWDVTDEQVWVSPGADGALDYLSRATLEPGDRVLVPEPGFAYYPMSTRYHHGTTTTYPLSAADDFAQDAATVLDAYDGERVVYVTSPHNPTGTELPREELVEIVEAVDDHTLVAVDEAYGEYTDRPSAIGLLEEYDNVAVTRTFSKAYGLAGLRVGYAVVPESWADAYARINTPFAANAVALAAARAALDDDEHVATSVESAAWAREYVHERLGVPTVDGAGNFLLAHVGDVDPSGVAGVAADAAPGEAVAEAAKRRGVIVRDTGSFGLPEYVRISCGTRAETRTAVAVLDEVFTALDATAYDPAAAGPIDEAARADALDPAETGSGASGEETGSEASSEGTGPGASGEETESEASSEDSPTEPEAEL